MQYSQLHASQAQNASATLHAHRLVPKLSCAGLARLTTNAAAIPKGASVIACVMTRHSQSACGATSTQVAYTTKSGYRVHVPRMRECS